MSNAPAATRALLLLRTLAEAPGPQHAAVLARALGLPRSSTYHLLAAMAATGFVAHYPEDERWGLGIAALEIGTAYQRQDPLARVAHPVLRSLSGRLSLPGVVHCGVLHDRETLYVAIDRTARPATVVVDVGVRLPAALTASGRAMLAALPDAQVRALFPDRASFVDRTGVGPRSLAQLRGLLAQERRTGVAVEEGFVVSGYSSVAACARDRVGAPVASIGVTVPRASLLDEEREHLAAAVRRAAQELSRRLGADVG